MTDDQEPTRVEDLQPLALTPCDRLGVEFDVDSQEFMMRARSLTTDPARRAVGSKARFLINGVEHYESWDGVSQQAMRFFENLPECKWHKMRDRYAVAATDLTAAIVTRMWGGDSRLVFVDDVAKSVFEQLLVDYSERRALAMSTALFKTDKVIPKLPPAWRERKDAEMAPYQRAAVSLALQSRSFALFMDRGTGKTACGIQSVCVLASCAQLPDSDLGVTRDDGGRMIRVLIICPQQVRLNWQREFAKFSWVPGRVTILRGDRADRVRCCAEMITAENGVAFSVVIASYDSVARTEAAAIIPWDLVVADESHYFKDPNTNRFAAMTRIRESSRRRIILTGTPMGNSPMDLWAQLEFLQRGGSGFSSFKTFRSFHGVYEKTNNSAQGVSKLVGLKNIPFLQERLARMSFAVTKEEAGLHLPDKVYQVESVEMTPYQAEVYNRLQDQLALEIEDKLSGEVVDEMTINNVLTMLLRLAQVTSGFVTYDARFDPETNEVVTPKRVANISDTNPKTEALLARLAGEDRDPKGKTIVWCVFVHNIKHISESLTAAGIKHVVYYGGTSHADRDAAVDVFNNDPECKAIVCNPQTAGEGLNLLGYNMQAPSTSDTYCDQEVFYSSNWSAIQRAQAEDRAHRRGTRMPVQIIDLVVPGTIDEEILDRVMSKRKMADAVSDLRDTLTRILGRKAVAGGV